MINIDDDRLWIANAQELFHGGKRGRNGKIHEQWAGADWPPAEELSFWIEHKLLTSWHRLVRNATHDAHQGVTLNKVTPCKKLGWLPNASRVTIKGLCQLST